MSCLGCLCCLRQQKPLVWSQLEVSWVVSGPYSPGASNCHNSGVLHKRGSESESPCPLSSKTVPLNPAVCLNPKP